MIRYNKETKTITMDLTDLEHCGFDHDEYKSELFLAGLDDKDMGILFPQTLSVNFAGGAVKVVNKKCSWFDCNKKAIWSHARSGNVFCDDHAKLNNERFLGLMSYERIRLTKRVPDARKSAPKKVSSKSKGSAKPARG